MKYLLLVVGALLIPFGLIFYLRRQGKLHPSAAAAVDATPAPVRAVGNGIVQAGSNITAQGATFLNAVSKVPVFGTVVQGALALAGALGLTGGLKGPPADASVETLNDFIANLPDIGDIKAKVTAIYNQGRAQMGLPLVGSAAAATVSSSGPVKSPPPPFFGGGGNSRTPGFRTLNY